MCRRGTTEGTLKELLSKPTLFWVRLNFGTEFADHTNTVKSKQKYYTDHGLFDADADQQPQHLPQYQCPRRPSSPSTTPFFGAASHVVRA